MKKTIDKIDWAKQNDLIPTITQDATTNEVLMLAYMNKESLKLSLKTSYAHYFSRSKNRIWKKGETSNHTQEIIDILLDCDNDTLLLKVNQKGVACHTGRSSCFFKSIKDDNIICDIQIKTNEIYGVIDTLYHTILQRKNTNSHESYTSSLLNGKQNSMLKKIVEEAGEFTFAIKDDDKKEIVYEGADLLYHSLVALASKNISPSQIKKELEKRFNISGIEEKNSRV
ncbi:Phosphoribosyl-AMP cyclohydrolase / Phosphoribosyl-ATP pyrophosphatase [hydrothermal vent metagenome]|uniref:Histidine biosynthesis bifunctional protein HisIE n=1 Tax=hydrothermal vent metagenome TaxID=652676 RepID=A0A3B1DU98_9ZZZZ